MPLDTMAAGSRRTALKTRTLASLLAEPYPAREPLLHPVLKQGESMMLWAQTGAGKTWLSLTMALAIAGGGTFIGWSAEKPRRVLLVDGEMAMEDLQDRLRVLAGTVEGLDAEAAGSNLLILARQDQSADVLFPDIGKEEGQDAVLRMAQGHGAELVLLDNFSTLAEVEDENAASAMNPVLSFLLRLKQARLACVLVHHSGKDGGNYRGSSKLAATFEVILGLVRENSAGSVTGAAFTTQWDKFRSAPHPTLVPRDVALVDGPDGVLLWRAEPAERDKVRAYLAALETGQCSSQREIAKACGWSEGEASKVRGRAILAGRLTEARLKEVFAAVNEGRRAGPDVGLEAPF
ncbi:AAA family ATPase [Roseomonas sp. NAR14]|uniref:AAA family ATPase n=1 Tax=Roseomonas acroporae TaxID=2937791 RepID=A0A9X1Y8Q6_9PROT|nr:AAA family ATPase [Roseomonas acroporae]MCK8784172.1 AAA family ATPase [Roseomonas acroporae]